MAKHAPYLPKHIRICSVEEILLEGPLSILYLLHDYLVKSAINLDWLHMKTNYGALTSYKVIAQKCVITL